MATRTLTSRRNLEIELSNILILGAIFVFIFSGCKTYLSVRSFVEGISAPSDHYPHHPNTSTGRFVHGDLRLKLFQIFVIKQLRVSASSGLKYCTKRLPKLKTSMHKK